MKKFKKILKIILSIFFGLTPLFIFICLAIYFFDFIVGFILFHVAFYMTKELIKYWRN